MRQTKSAHKEISKFNQNSYKNVVEGYRQANRLKLKPPSKNDSELIQQFYILHMIQVYNKNSKGYPNPTELLDRLKVKEKKLQQLECQFGVQRPSRQSQKSLKSQTRTQTTNFTTEQVKVQANYKKILDQEYYKLKLRFIPIFQNFVTGTQQLIKLSAAENEKVTQILFQCISKVIKALKAQILTVQERSNIRLIKKIQNVQQKYANQLKNHNLHIQKLNNKNKQLAQQARKHGEHKKKLQKQKNELHTEIFKLHQSIIEKSKCEEELTDRLEGQLKRVEEMEKKLDEAQKTIKNTENTQKQSLQFIAQLEQKNHELEEMVQKFKKEVTINHKRVQQQFSRQLSRVRSQQNFSSIKVIGQNNNSNLISQIADLREKIKNYEERQRLRQFERQQEQKRQKLSLQDIVKQWKKHSQDMVQQNDRQIRVRDEYIKTLQGQTLQLKKQIALKDQLMKCHYQGLPNQPRNQQ